MDSTMPGRFTPDQIQALLNENLLLKAKVTALEAERDDAVAEMRVAQADTIRIMATHTWLIEKAEAGKIALAIEAVLAEREACALLCEAQYEGLSQYSAVSPMQLIFGAKSIRSRGQGREPT